MNRRKFIQNLLAAAALSASLLGMTEAKTKTKTYRFSTYRGSGELCHLDVLTCPSWEPNPAWEEATPVCWAWEKPVRFTLARSHSTEPTHA